MYEYRATVVRVVDADTIWLDVDLGLDTHIKLSVRLAGINAPETSTTEGQTAKAYVDALLPVGMGVTLLTTKDRKEKYGRYLGTIIVAGINLNALLIDEGYATTYPPVAP